MKSNSKIKVIKKADAAELRKVRRRPRKKVRAGNEMLTTVAGWVADLNGRKSKDVHAAVNSLFGPAAVPNES
ncbi:MAG TPA: hypothetical protein VGO43_04875 [Pyrinomonadaceae bacterium]|jgi:hypothetical protein|nr:hypothetical protein [Pyrinomonadaceae bacterium]